MRIQSVLWWAAVVVGIVCFAPAAWWLTGGNHGGVEPEWDYLWHPPDVSKRTGHAIGALSVVSAGSAVSVVWVAVRRRIQRRTLVFALLPFALMAAYAGCCYSVATAPVIGANIGAGMLLFLAIPLSVGLVTWALIAVDRHRRGGRLSGGR